MKIKNEVIQEPLCLRDTKTLYNQLREIDSLTCKEEVSTLVDNDRKCLTINRCVHPNLFIISYVIKGHKEQEIVITEREIYES